MLKKDITFIYQDSSEKAQFQPVADEAIKRGYCVKFTTNLYEECEIGFYCQHVNYPRFSKFSVIMLHDIIQQYSNWPDIWFNEPWNMYDIGILPSNQWVKNWNQSSKWFYARPKKGIYKIGWPKADAVSKIAETESNLKEKYNINKNKRTILYAPAWENDNKQDDFVRAMQKLDVNILIKQADWSPKYQEQIDNIKKMAELHKNLPGVIILPPSTNIFSAIAISDVLVSEESSTMCESVMLGIPAVSVSDWLIPDVTPSRYPKCDYSFVTTTKKCELTNCISNILNDYETYKNSALDYSRENFENIGHSSSLIMDIIDDYVNNTKCRQESLTYNLTKRMNVFAYFKHKLIFLRRNIIPLLENSNKVFGKIIKNLRTIKRKIFN